MTEILPIRCGLFRRLLAIAYDCLLLAGVLFMATAALLLFTGGNAIHSGNYLYLLYLILCCHLYFCWQWTHGGQTLGMRAWKVRMITPAGGTISWRLASLHFSLALLSWLLLGGGFLWALVDAQGRTMHDRYSGTGLYRV
jgi:uncharacterized RDD family membrane protein YckC